MLLRHVVPRRPLPALRGWQVRMMPPSRAFHATRKQAADVELQDYYATLQVRHDASTSDIKRSFYSLSKAYHPDHNPDNPEASRRFMLLSEAYTVLGHAEKRAAYDRDVLGRQLASRSRPRGSYSSSHNTGPAGGRPASGLSRRRGSFQGPPPSFYRSGGWGAHGAKRRTAHDHSTGGAGPDGAGGPQRMAGMGHGQDPYGHRDDVYHFDREGHQRTGEWVTSRRSTPKGPGLEPDTSPIAQFVIFTSLLTFAVYVPLRAMFDSERDVKRRPK